MDLISASSAAQEQKLGFFCFSIPFFFSGAVKRQPAKEVRKKEGKNRIVQLAVKYTVDDDDAYHGSSNRRARLVLS